MKSKVEVKGTIHAQGLKYYITQRLGKRCFIGFPDNMFKNEESYVYPTPRMITVFGGFILEEQPRKYFVDCYYPPASERPE